MKYNKLIYGGLIAVIFWSGYLCWKGLRNDKIAYVDTIKLIQEHKGMKDAIADYEKKEKDMLAKVDTLKMELEKKIQDYDKTKSSLGPQNRKEVEQKLIIRQNQFLQYKQTIEEKIKKDKQEITQRILVPVDEFVKSYGEKHNYKIILGATSMGNIVFADEELDITDEILKELNK